MTTMEVEDVVRALSAVAENLEAGAAKQSMQEAFTQVRAHAGDMRALAMERPRRQRQNRGLNMVARNPLPNPVVRMIAAMLDEILVTPRQNG